MTQVLHLIPSTKVGGVEVAAGWLRSELRTFDSGVSYRLMALGRDRAEVQAITPDVYGAGLNSPLSVVSVLRYLRRTRSNVLVTSLWRSVLVGIFVKAFVPHVKWVVWVHNTRHTNFADRWAHYFAFRWADEVFCDSIAARESLVPPRLRSRAKIIRPVVGGRVDSTDEVRDPRSLVYWGRLSSQKRLDRAVRLLAELDGFRLNLFGPDEGEWSGIESLARELGVADRLTWHGAVRPTEIFAVAKGQTFFVQLSDFEGFGMSVVEAMRLGLIPVATPVGEIGSYAVSGVNAVVVDPEALPNAAEILRELVDAPDVRERMSRAAREVTFNDFVTTFVCELKAVGA